MAKKRIPNETKGEVIYANAWMYDESKFPKDQCIYVVGFDYNSIEANLTGEEMKAYKFYIFVNDTHHFREFPMPPFPIMFIKDWKRHMYSRRIDFDMVNFAVKHSIKLINYDGENGDMVNVASDQKELKLHGFLGRESKPIDSIKWHPEVQSNQPTYLDFE